ncbi:MAG: hypothetical protein U0V64_14670 [Cyclobacteriaceae bacterium]
MSNMWMVRAGEHGYLIEEFPQKNVVGLGWNDLGDLRKIGDASRSRASGRNTPSTRMER